MSRLARLLKLSNRTVVLVDSLSSCPGSPPSAMHYSLVTLEREGMVQSVVSLDQHSALQKAGFPQVFLHIIGELQG